MKLTKIKLRELIAEEMVNVNRKSSSAEEDPFSKIIEFDDWGEAGNEEGIAKLSPGFGVGEAILMQALVSLANYIAPEIIDYVKGELIDKGINYAYKLLAYKIFEMLVNDKTFEAGRMSPLRLFPSIEPLRVSVDSLNQLSQQQLEAFKLAVKNEIMNSDDHPFKIDVEQILTNLSGITIKQAVQLQESRMIKLAGL